MEFLGRTIEGIRMQSKTIVEILNWLAIAGNEGMDLGVLFAEFCSRCVDAGLPLSHGMTLIDTVHPDFEGSVFYWDSIEPVERPVENYQFSSSGRGLEVWQTSVFHHLLETGGDEFHQPLRGGEQLPFYRQAELREKGHTDYIAAIHRFTKRGSIGEMTAVYSSWTTRAPKGFRAADIRALRSLLPSLALAFKSGTSGMVAKTIARVYLGNDAAGRVIDGQIIRGAAETIDAVIWFSDLKNYTAISDQADPHEIIPFLNDYAGLVIDAIHSHGGSVLKLMGDGILAIFRAEDMEIACRAALKAEKAFRRELEVLNERRSQQDLPFTGVYVGLHVGEVFYGNIGSRDRLDFTVVGPAVNEVSRICASCRPTGCDMLVSEEFAVTCPDAMRTRLALVGEFSLRGIAEPMRLFTTPE